MAAGGPRLASDQRRAFIERVAVFVVQRHHGALLAREAAVAAVEVQITYPMSLITPLLGKFVGGNPVTIAADLQARAQY